MTPTEFLILAEYLGKIAIVLAIGFLTVRMLNRQTSAIKHRIWMAVFIASIAILAILALPRLPLIPLVSSKVVDLPAPALEAPPVSRPAGIAPMQMPSESAAARRFNWVSATTFFWLAGVAVTLGRTAIASYALRRLKRFSSSVSPTIQQSADALIASMEIQQPVSLSISDQIQTPFAWGLRRSEILLPTEADTWSQAELDMVLRHELAHVLRRDPAALFVSRLFVALNWINPLSWIAARQAMKLREEACDRYVLDSGHTRTDYATLLFSQAQRSVPTSLRAVAVSMADSGTVESRIQKILHPTSTPGASSSRITVAVCAVATLSLLIGFTGCTEAEKAPVVAKADFEEKLKTLIIPQLEFADTPLDDALAFIQKRSVELDTASPPESRGVNIILEDSDGPQPKITLRLTNVPLRETLRYVTQLAQREFVVESHAVIIREKTVTAADDAVFEIRPIGDPVTISSSTASSPEPESPYSEEDLAKIAAMDEKIRKTILPSIEFVDTPLRDALDFIRARATELDASEAESKGFNLILSVEDKRHLDTRITLRLSNVPVIEALRYSVSLAQLDFAIQPDSIVVSDSIKPKPQAQISGSDEKKVAAIQSQLESITFPSIEFVDTPFLDALDFLQSRSLDMDDTPDRGFNLIVRDPNLQGKEDPPRITLKLSNVSVGEALRYTTDLARYRFHIEPNAVVVTPLEAE